MWSDYDKKITPGQAIYLWSCSFVWFVGRDMVKYSRNYLCIKLKEDDQWITKFEILSFTQIQFFLVSLANIIDEAFMMRWDTIYKLGQGLETKLFVKAYTCYK